MERLVSAQALQVFSRLPQRLVPMNFGSDSFSQALILGTATRGSVASIVVAPPV